MTALLLALVSGVVVAPPAAARGQTERTEPAAPSYADIQVRPEEGLVRGALVLVTGTVELVGSEPMTRLAVRVRATGEREAELILLEGSRAEALRHRQNSIMHIEGQVIREVEDAQPAAIRVIEARPAVRQTAD